MCCICCIIAKAFFMLSSSDFPEAPAGPSDAFDFRSGILWQSAASSVAMMLGAAGPSAEYARSYTRSHGLSGYFAKPIMECVLQVIFCNPLKSFVIHNSCVR